MLSPSGAGIITRAIRAMATPSSTIVVSRLIPALSSRRPSSSSSISAPTTMGSRIGTEMRWSMAGMVTAPARRHGRCR